jgi:hypothetical protein
MDRCGPLVRERWRATLGALKSAEARCPHQNHDAMPRGPISASCSLQTIRHTTRDALPLVDFYLLRIHLALEVFRRYAPGRVFPCPATRDLVICITARTPSPQLCRIELAYPTLGKVPSYCHSITHTVLILQGSNSETCEDSICILCNSLYAHLQPPRIWTKIQGKSRLPKIHFQRLSMHPLSLGVRYSPIICSSTDFSRASDRLPFVHNCYKNQHSCTYWSLVKNAT